MNARLVHCAASLAIALLAPFSVARSQSAPQPKRVLVLYGHDPNAPGAVAFTTALQESVRADSFPRVTFYNELLDLDRFPERARREETANSIVGKYRDFHFDAILTVGTRALQFAMDRMRPLFPDVPIVFGAAFEPSHDFSALPKNVTGRHQPPPFVATLQLARALQPDAERVVLIAGSSPADSALFATATREISPLLGALPLVVWRDWTYASLLERMPTLSPRTITILSGFARDWSGQDFNEGDLVASVTRMASAPVYGIARNWVGDGIVGGATIDFAEDGTRTGQILLHVLDRPSNRLPLPPPEVARPLQVVDWRALERWGLSERHLPAGTKILFRTPTIWERYWALFLATVVVIAAQSVLIAMLLLERRRRMRAIHQVQRSRDQVAHVGRVATLGELTAAISHELRQPLAAIRANAEAGRLMLDRTPSDVSQAREAFEDIANDDLRAVEVLDQIRALVRKDDPIETSVDLNDVCNRCSDLLMYEAVQRGVHLRLSLEPALPSVIGDPVQLQQVVLNLALNGMEAAQSSPGIREVVLGTSRLSKAEVELFVRDTGPGLTPHARRRAFEPFFTTKPQGLGMGLAIVRSIIERHRGRVLMENESAGGAIFRVQLPLADADSLRARARARDV